MSWKQEQKQIFHLKKGRLPISLRFAVAVFHQSSLLAGRALDRMRRIEAQELGHRVRQVMATLLREYGFEHQRRGQAGRVAVLLCF